MAELPTRVSGDWIEIREAAKDYQSLDTHFRIPEAQLRIQIEKLDSAVEQGIVEYKRSSLGPLFNMLEGARYKSPSFEELERQIGYTSALLFVMLIQRQLVQGIVKPIREKKQEQTISPEDLDLKEILKDINVRLKANPGLNADPAVKNILLQAVQLRKERENLQKLLPTIKPESKETFLANYRKTFGEIIDKIKRSYASILQKEMPVVPQGRSILEAVGLNALLPTLTEQCEAVSRLRSTLSYAIEEKYKIRELLVNLGSEKEHLNRLLERESALYAKMSSDSASQQIEGDRAVGRAFCREIIRFLERQLSHAEAGIR